MQTAPPLIRQPQGLTPSPKIRGKAYIASANINYRDIVLMRENESQISKLIPHNSNDAIVPSLICAVLSQIVWYKLSSVFLLNCLTMFRNIKRDYKLAFSRILGEGVSPWGWRMRGGGFCTAKLTSTMLSSICNCFDNANASPGKESHRYLIWVCLSLFTLIICQ